jgi:DNA-3-methyladenine glycosylase II
LQSHPDYFAFATSKSFHRVVEYLDLRACRIIQVYRIPGFRLGSRLNFKHQCCVNKRAIEHLQSDPAMARVIKRIGVIRHRPRRLPPFQSLVHAIIHQQLSGKAAGTILGRFRALFGGDFPSPRDVLAMAPEALRAAGLSRPKTAYIIELAEKAGAELVPSLQECDEMADAEIMDRLTAIKGVGRWTVEMLLIFNLGRPDVLPVYDLGVRRGFQIAHGKRKLPVPEHLARHGIRWAPHRTAAALYLWRAADFRDRGW